MYLIRNLDRYSPEIKLRYNESYTNIKSSFGGILSLLSYFLFIAAAMFFARRFFNRENFSINQSIKISSLNSIRNFNEVPFMITTNVNPTNVTDQLTYFQFTAKKRSVLQTVSSNEVSTPYNFVPCDINNTQHVPTKYKDAILQSGYDVSLYFCIDWNNDTADLVGTYGENQNITSMSYTVLACSNKTSAITCKSPKDIMKAIQRINLSILTLSNEIDHTQESPFTPAISAQKIRSNVFMETDIYVFYKNIEYNSDEGFLLQDVKTTNLFQFGGITTEIGDFNSSFAFQETFTYFRLYLTVAREKIIYTRIYEKAQNVLAFVGGIINMLILIATMINYVVGQRMFYLEIYNSIPELQISESELMLNAPKGQGMGAKNNYVGSKLNTNKTLLNKLEISGIKLSLPKCFWTRAEKTKFQVVETKVNKSLCLIEIIKDISLLKNLISEVIPSDRFNEAFKILKQGNVCQDPGLNFTVNLGAKLDDSKHKINNALPKPNQ